MSFLRKTRKSEECLLIICNFSAVAYEDYRVGVPYAGKYKEIFNSDAKEFGGSNVVNPRVKASKKEECDERKHSISVKVPPLGISVYSYTKAVEKLSDNTAAKSRKKSASPKVRKNLKKNWKKK